MPETIVVDGLHVTVERPAAPTRPPIVMVHGMFAGAWPFAHYQRHFAALGHPTFAVDLRGHLGSRPVSDIGRVRMRDFADDAIAVVRHVARVDGRPVLLGHSMGGLVTQLAAAQLGDRVGALVLLCSAPPRGIPVMSVPLLKRLPAQLPSLLRSRALVPRREDADDLNFNRVPPDERAALFARYVPESGRAALEMAVGRVDVDATAVRCPVLSVGATEDRTVPVAISGRIARKYGGTHLAFTAHAHFILLEPGWEQPATAIAGWLEGATA